MERLIMIHKINELGFIQNYQTSDGTKYHIYLKGTNIWDLTVIDIIHIIEKLEKVIS